MGKVTKALAVCKYCVSHGLCICGVVTRQGLTSGCACVMKPPSVYMGEGYSNGIEDPAGAGLLVGASQGFCHADGCKES